MFVTERRQHATAYQGVKLAYVNEREQAEARISRLCGESSPRIPNHKTSYACKKCLGENRFEAGPVASDSLSMKTGK